MCGIVGIVSDSPAQRPVNQRLYDALTILQHRGQDAAGIVTCDNGRLFMRKENGLVRDVFELSHMQALTGSMGIGHCRYPTAGSASCAESQPFYVNSPYGITLAHNGNLTNASELAKNLFQEDLRHLNTESDSEVLLNVLAHELQVLNKLQATPDDLFTAVRNLHARCVGGYAVVAMITGYGILGFRDPFGIRPLVYGKRESDEGTEYMMASESVAIEALDFEMIADVAPGEAIFIDLEGNIFRQQCHENPVLSPCIFEHVYLARPDSLMDGVSIYKTRLRQGERLADKIKRENLLSDVDVVIPIPDSGRTAAMQLANHLNLTYREGFIKNRYIGRTFIMPGQTQRKKSVRQKLNPIDLEFKGKNVLLVDDSIVRGTTSHQIVDMAREAGANKVYYASAAPQVIFPNVYGIDMPAAEELIAHGRSVEQICQQIGADSLVYQDLEDLVAASREGNANIDHFECSVFNGKYVTGDVTDHYLKRLQQDRNDTAKQNHNGLGSGIASHSVLLNPLTVIG